MVNEIESAHLYIGLTHTERQFNAMINSVMVWEGGFMGQSVDRLKVAYLVHIYQLRLNSGRFSNRHTKL